MPCCIVLYHSSRQILYAYCNVLGIALPARSNHPLGFAECEAGCVWTYDPGFRLEAARVCGHNCKSGGMYGAEDCSRWLHITGCPEKPTSKRCRTRTRPRCGRMMYWELHCIVLYLYLSQDEHRYMLAVIRVFQDTTSSLLTSEARRGAHTSTQS